MLPRCSPLLITFLALHDAAQAIRLPLRSRWSPSILKRSGVFSDALNNTNNLLYFTNITLGGQEFTVQIDTGSADLWVGGNPPGSQSTGKNTSVSYAVGVASGPIQTADFTMAGQSVSAQAFIQVDPNDPNAPDAPGIIGLGPSDNSNVKTAIGSKTGDPPLDRIFAQNSSTPNFITVLLGRAFDPSSSSDPASFQTSEGELTIGEVLSGYEAVQSAPQLNVTTVNLLETGNQHWQVLLDADGLVGPDGNFVTLTSTVSSIESPTQARVVLDSGFTLPQVPSNIAQSIYGGVSGAALVNVSGVGNIWTLPCTQEINITWRFGGQSFNVHPLDATIPIDNITDVTDTGASSSNDCAGAFQPQSFSNDGKPTFDMIFGMSFLRNAYVLINFGDFVDGGSSKANPFVQMISTTNDTARAHSDFVQARLGGVDSTTQLNALGHMNQTPSSNPSSKSRVIKFAVIAGVGALVILCLLVGCCCFCGRRILGLLPGRRNRRNKGGIIGQGSYQPLEAPAPGHEYNANQGPLYRPQYDIPLTQTGYSDPYVPTNQHHYQPSQ